MYSEILNAYCSLYNYNKNIQNVDHFIEMYKQIKNYTLLPNQK